jgi:hypothetical protein
VTQDGVAASAARAGARAAASRMKVFAKCIVVVGVFILGRWWV